LFLKNAVCVKEAKFIERNKGKWNGMEQPEKRVDQLADDFVELSDDLSYARTFYPGSDTEHYLNRLMARFQTRVYKHRSHRKKGIREFWKTEFPGLIYRERKTLLFALCFFIAAVVLGGFSAGKDEGFVRLILGDGYVNKTLDNIEQGTPMGIYASLGAWEMFWRITINNIQVSFFAFVYGLLFSAGTLWILLQNGVMIGVFQYFFYARGLLLHSALSVWAHGTFEITAIVMAGGAGLVMGNSFLFPGTCTRGESFRAGALKGIQIVVGLIPFFIIAGAIESCVTRYADAHPRVGLVAILLSLAGVIAYFVWYPYYITHKTDHEENRIEPRT
jgi:uncharacterized membrane protein SpoIIM required for sporulation